MQISRPILSHKSISASNGMAVAQHPLATEAGVDVLQRGGNAVDAAVTMAFATGVLQPLMNGIGGGGLMVIRMADGRTAAIDYGMRAPAAASEDMYELEDEPEERHASSNRFSRHFAWPKVVGNANLARHTSIATPGTVAGLSAALEKWGKWELADVLGPAIRFAEEGFDIGHHFALSLLNGRSKFLAHPATAAVYYPDGYPIPVGGRFVQADHAHTLRLIAQDGPRAFYEGEPAQRIVDDVRAHGSRLSLDDFASYEAIVIPEALSTTYRNVTLFEVPGLGASPTLTEILNILENFDLRMLGQGSANTLHTVIEAIKLAGADRFTYLGDCAPGGAPMAGLTAKTYAADRAMEIGRAALAPEAGNPWEHNDSPRPSSFPEPVGLGPDGGTTTLAVSDSLGNFVALTQTNHGFSGVVNPGVGVMMNNGMGWFYPGPGTVNSIAPRGRGLHNMVPVILEEDGLVKAALGSSGGRRIWTAIAQIIVNMVDFDMPLQEALEAPRVHVETDDVLIDGCFDQSVRDALSRSGHELTVATPGYVRAPFSEPNGIEVRDGTFASGVYPVCKPTVAMGY